MDEARRLDLIVEAVRYCQRVRDMGMPASSYSKALREPVHFHAVPFRYLQKELLDLPDVTRESVGDVLKKHCVVVLVTKEENDQLNNAKLGSKMPEGWNGADQLARYAAAGIEVVPNA